MKGVDDQMAELRRRVHSHMVGRLAIALKILRSWFFFIRFLCRAGVTIVNESCKRDDAMKMLS